MEIRPEIDPAERERRAEIVRYARGSIGLEGFTLPPEVDPLDRRYIAGEIDKAQHTAECLRLAGLAHSSPYGRSGWSDPDE